MTATLTQVRQALATTLSMISGLRVYAFPKGEISPPAAVIMPADGQFLTYRVTMDTTHDLELTVTVFTQWGADANSTEALDAYLADSGTKSIYAAVNADQTLGSTVDSCTVVAAQNHGKVTYAGADYFAVEFQVEVLL